MTTIIAIITILIGFMIVLAKAIGSGAKATYDYTANVVTPPVKWVKDKAVEAKTATGASTPVTAIKTKANKAEKAARLFIEALEHLD